MQAFYLVVLGLLAIIGSTTARRHHGRPPCGLPPFVEKLPGDQAMELREIWKNYRKGADCESEREATKELVDGLPWHIRRTIFHHGPSFLKNATEETREQFRKMWHNRTLRGDAKKAAIQALAARTLNPVQMREFEKWSKEQDKKHKEFEAKMEKLSPEARTAFDKLESLRDQKAAIFDGLSISARDELHALWSHRNSRGGGHRRHRQQDRGFGKDRRAMI